ncbi:MAG: hypothetical protein IJA97_00495 [Clostridia bacterium]|nr:hypothetical protein [Clostridia bacterium]
MRLKKSLFTAFIAVVLSLFCVFPTQSVIAEESVSTHASTLASGYAEATAFINGGGVFTTENVDGLIVKTSSAVKSAEFLKGAVTETEYADNFRNAHTAVLQVCKNAHVWKMENGYDPDIYSETSGGIVLVHQKLSESSLAIKTATEYSQIQTAYDSWQSFITSRAASLKVKTLNGVGVVSVKLSSAQPIFAEDDALIASEFTNSVIVKNTKSALKDNDELDTIESGLAYYLSIRWKRDKVVKTGSTAPVEVTIELEDMGLKDATYIQVARYVGGEKVAFLDGVTVEDGYIKFTLENFGADIESDYALDFAIIARGYKAKPTYTHVYIIIGVSVILILVIVLRIVVGVKRRRKRKEYKTFARQRKLERKYKKLEE